MQLKVANDVNKKDMVNWSFSDEIKDLEKGMSQEHKEVLLEITNLVIKFDDIRNKEYLGDFESLKNNLMLNIKKDLWFNNKFTIEAFKLLAPIEGLHLIPIEGWNNTVVLNQIENNENFFKEIWYGGIELFINDKFFNKYIIEEQKKIYGEIEENDYQFFRLKLKDKLNELFDDIDWVISQVKDNPYLYPYLSKKLRLNDNVLALTFSAINQDEKEKALFIELIPYQEIAKDPYITAAFLNFFYYKVNKYREYFSHLLKLFKSETQVQAVIEFLEDEEVFCEVFNHKDFPLSFKENSTVLLQSLKKSKDIYLILPEYMRGSKSVVEIMIYEHKSAYLDAKALDYWRQDIMEPKLSGPVYEYLTNNIADLQVLKFVHWRRSFDFIYSLNENPFDYNVPFSEGDFEFITKGDQDKAIKLIKKFPDFYQVANTEIKCNLDCVMEYIKNGSGLFEDRFNSINENFFFNDELIFECINNDIGEILTKIPAVKWDSKGFMYKYLDLIDSLKEQGEEAAVQCLYTFMPKKVQDYFNKNGVISNFKRFFKLDQLRKYSYT